MALQSHRDIFPLPCAGPPPGLCSTGPSARWLQEGIRALNSIGGRGTCAPSRPLAVLQAHAQSGLARVYAEIPEKPSDVTVQGALKAILGTDPGYGEDLTSGSHALYQRGRASLPRVATGVARLEDVLPERDRSLLVGESAGLLANTSSDISLNAPVAAASIPV